MGFRHFWLAQNSSFVPPLHHIRYIDRITLQYLLELYTAYICINIYIYTHTDIQYIYICILVAADASLVTLPPFEEVGMD